MIRKTIRLLLKQKNVGIAALFVFITSLSVGAGVFFFLLDDEFQGIANQHSLILSRANQLINVQLGDIRNSTLLFNSHITDLLEAQSVKFSPEDVFARVGTDYPSVSQVRWLSMDGQEKARVNFVEGSAVVVPKQALQNKFKRYYFRQVFKGQSGNVYLSPIDLNVENGKIEEPYKPTIRSAIKHTEHPLGQGVFIINFDLTSLFNELHQMGDSNTQLFVLRGDGEWMVYADREKEWAGLRGVDGIDVKEYYPLLWSEVTSQKAASLIRGKDRAVQSAVLINTTSQQAMTNESLVLIAHSPPQVFERIFRHCWVPALLAGTATGILFFVWLLRDILAKRKLDQLAISLAKERDALQRALKERKVLQQELVEAEKMASLGLLVAGIAHELNTPIGGSIMSLTGVQGKLTDIRAQLPHNLSYTKLESFLQYVEEATELSLLGLRKSASSIKRFKRLSVDRGSDDVITFSLEKLISDLVASLKPLLKPKQVTIAIDIKQSVMMTSRPGLISQVLQNLIINAVEHAFEDRVNNVIDIKVTIEDNIFISIADNGKGIASEIRSSVFDPFVTTARSKGNSGLGLHLVFLWVTQGLGGKVSVRSAEKGSEFMLELPINSAKHCQTPIDSEQK